MSRWSNMVVFAMKMILLDVRFSTNLSDLICVCCGDEVGGSINMEGDGYAGGQLIYVEKGQVPIKKYGQIVKSLP